MVCFLLATVIWLLNALNKESYTMTVQYPIQFVYDHTKYVPTTQLPKSITVSVTGSGWNLIRKSWLPFRSDPVRYVVAHPLETTSINTASLAAQLTDHTQDVHVNFVAGDTLDLSFDRLTVKEVPLVVDSTKINLADRVVISSLINVSPSSVRLSGPARLLRAMPDTLRLTIPARRLSNNYDEELRLNLPRHPLIQASADRALVSFEVTELLQPLPSSKPARKK